jgi:hypothetical protein
MGEFGAVSVVSGHIRGATNTVPLQVEILYNEYNFAAAFAVASLLALLALFTLGAKRLSTWGAPGAPQAPLRSGCSGYAAAPLDNAAPQRAGGPGVAGTRLDNAIRSHPLIEGRRGPIQPEERTTQR